MKLMLLRIRAAIDAYRKRGTAHYPLGLWMFWAITDRYPPTMSRVVRRAK